MKRSRPRQHKRRLKSGRVITVNKGIKKRSKKMNYGSSPKIRVPRAPSKETQRSMMIRVPKPPSKEKQYDTELKLELDGKNNDQGYKKIPTKGLEELERSGTAYEVKTGKEDKELSKIRGELKKRYNYGSNPTNNNKSKVMLGDGSIYIFENEKGKIPKKDIEELKKYGADIKLLKRQKKNYGSNPDSREVEFRKRLSRAAGREPFLRKGDFVISKTTGKEGRVVKSEDSTGTGDIVVKYDHKGRTYKLPSTAKHWELE